MLFHLGFSSAVNYQALAMKRLSHLTFIIIIIIIIIFIDLLIKQMSQVGWNPSFIMKYVLRDWDFHNLVKTIPY